MHRHHHRLERLLGSILQTHRPLLANEHGLQSSSSHLHALYSRDDADLREILNAELLPTVEIRHREHHVVVTHGRFDGAHGGGSHHRQRHRRPGKLTDAPVVSTGKFRRSGMTLPKQVPSQSRPGTSAFAVLCLGLLQGTLVAIQPANVGRDPRWRTS